MKFAKDNNCCNYEGVIPECQVEVRAHEGGIGVTLIAHKVIFGERGWEASDIKRDISDYDCM